jgi:hypothetical protein
MRVFALRASDFHLVTTAQTSSGLFDGWSDLGNPNPLAAYEIGSPEAVVDPTGQVSVFVKNYSGGISMRTLSPPGTWTDWSDLGGTGVIESVTATLTPRGLVELYAPTTSGIRRWASPSPGALPVGIPGLVGSPPAGPVTVVPSPDGRLQIFYRAAGNTTVRSIWRNGDGGWHGPVDLGSAPGSGTIAAAVTGGRVTLVAATTSDQLIAAHRSAGSVAFNRAWRNVPGLSGRQPAVGVDQAGQVFIGIIRADGTLRVRGQTEVISGSPYGERVFA